MYLLKAQISRGKNALCPYSYNHTGHLLPNINMKCNRYNLLLWIKTNIAFMKSLAMQKYVRKQALLYTVHRINCTSLKNNLERAIKISYS